MSPGAPKKTQPKLQDAGCWDAAQQDHRSQIMRLRLHFESVDAIFFLELDGLYAHHAKTGTNSLST